MAVNGRLQKELADIKKESVFNIYAEPKDGNIFQWDASIFGPIGTPYENGVFKLEIHIPSNYPFKPPLINFITRIYHPNIDGVGSICLDILKSKWSPALTISKILLSICSLLSDPNQNDPLVQDIANQLKNSPEIYFKSAKEWTATYAS